LVPLPRSGAERAACYPLFEARAIGAGFRREVLNDIRANLDEFDVFEITVDHYIHGSPRVRDRILEVADRKPVVVHGVGLSIGTAVEPDRAYLDQVAAFIERVRAPWYSEHLAFTGVPGTDLSELLPLPRTQAALDVVAGNLEVVRAHIDAPVLLENITYYFTYPTDELSELEFLTRVLDSTGALLLLDLENVSINARNHGLDADAFIDALPRRAVRAMHVAGGISEGGLSIDSHSRPVSDHVWALLDRVLETQSPDVIIVERDDDLGRFADVIEDCRRARRLLARRSDAVESGPRRDCEAR
jgi:uncharacterized protein (UPF0276 family)